MSGVDAFNSLLNVLKSKMVKRRNTLILQAKIFKHNEIKCVLNNLRFRN